MPSNQPPTTPAASGNPAYPHRDQRERLVDEAETHRHEENVPARPAKEIKKAETDAAVSKPAAK